MSPMERIASVIPDNICDVRNFWTKHQCQRVRGHQGAHLHYDGQGTEGWG